MRLSYPVWFRLGRLRFKEERSDGELDLGSVAYRVDDGDTRDWHSVHGLHDTENSASDGKPEPSQAAAFVCDSGPGDRRGRTSSGRAAWDRSSGLGGGILVAWRAQLAGRGSPLLR